MLTLQELVDDPQLLVLDVNKPYNILKRFNQGHAGQIPSASVDPESTNLKNHDTVLDRFARFETESKSHLHSYTDGIAESLVSSQNGHLSDVESLHDLTFIPQYEAASAHEFLEDGAENESCSHSTFESWNNFYCQSDVLSSQRFFSDIYTEDMVQQSRVCECVVDASKDPLILTHKCPSQEVFWSLLLTARAYVSVHFSWNEEEQVFEWVKLNRRKKWLKQKELLKRRLEKDNNFSDEDIQIKLLQDELEHIDLLAEDRIRIQGTSIAASQSMIFRFLAVGSLQRRIRQRVEVLCRSDKSDAQPSCAELFTLRSCMMNVLALLEEELEQWSRSFALHKQNEPALFRAWSELQVTENILTRLAQVFSCNLSDALPFPSLFPSSSHKATKGSSTKRTCRILSLLYSHLQACAVDGSSPLHQGIFRYLLGSVSRHWREQIAQWIGWPSNLTKLYDNVDVKISQRNLSKEENNYKARISSTCSQEPWAGMEVEWSWDEQDELDIGYVLRPARLPSFISLSQAREILEAGRALRLLQSVAPRDHPLLCFRDSDALFTRTSPFIPSWVWREENAKQQLQTCLAQIRDVREEIALWRTKRANSFEGQQTDRGDKSNALSATRDVKLPQKSKDESDDLGRLRDSLSKYDGNPRVSIANETVHGEGGNLEEESLLSHLDCAVRQADCGVGQVDPARLTQKTLITPLIQWSQLVNSSLISVYFQDLHLEKYLDVYMQFFLLGDSSFSQRLNEVLFASYNTDAEENHINNQGLSPLMIGNVSWPPQTSDLSASLNNIILESVAEKRSCDTFGEYDTSTSSVFQDLERRLSFAMVKPSSAKTESRDLGDIGALDWLTLTFHPPSLIAPLVTFQTQISYQRLFNHLVRLMRINSVLKTCFGSLMSRNSSKESRKALHCFDATLFFSFRQRANHFVTVLTRYVFETVIKQQWTIFRSRLNQLCREVEGREKIINDSDEVEDGVDGAHEDDFADDLTEDDENQSTRSDRTKGALRHKSFPHATFELKDVFSIAAYHERVVDRMVQGCFLKKRQRAIMNLINDMFNLILEFNRLVAWHLSPASPHSMMPRPISELLTIFESKNRLLLHSLQLVVHHGQRKDKTSMHLHKRKLNQYTSKATSVARSDAIHAEIARQEEQARHDLEQLEYDGGNDSRNVELVHALASALEGY